MTSLPLKRRAMWPLGRWIRRAIPVPFGWHTRYIVASHFRHTFLVATAILTIALSIDLTFFLSKVLATIATWNTSWTSVYLAWYIVLRGTDFLAELLPLACFFGVFWTETAHTFSRERLVVWLTGRTPLQCLLPALIFGIIIGGMQLALNLYLRPEAVMVMARDRLGSYGERFDPRPQPDPQWLALGRDLVQALVEPGDPPLLRDVKIYRMDDSLSLRMFLLAKSARPVGPGEWLLVDGYRWSPSKAASQRTFTWDDPKPPAIAEQIPFASETIHLELSPIWLNNRRVGARYLPSGTFSALAHENFSPNSEFLTWQQARWSLALFCGAMALLATSLSLVMIAKRIAFARLAAIAIAGYAANTLMKVSVLLGEHGYAHPAVSAWLVPLLTLSACSVVGLVSRNDWSGRSNP